MSASDLKPTDLRLGSLSAVDPGCVKTLFKSKFAANLPDFRKLQFAKALISLNLEFWRLDFNHNLIRSLTFSHSLDPKRKVVVRQLAKPIVTHNGFVALPLDCHRRLSEAHMK